MDGSNTNKSISKLELQDMKSVGKKQNAPIHAFLDKIGPGEQSKIDASLINYLIANNMDFSTIETTSFIGFIKSLRPAYKPPSIENLVQSTLEEFYYDYTTKNIAVTCCGILLVSAQACNDLVTMIYDDKGNYCVIKTSVYSEDIGRLINNSIDIVKQKFNQEIHAIISNSEIPISSINLGQKYWYFQCMSLKLKQLLNLILDASLSEKINKIFNEIEKNFTNSENQRFSFDNVEECYNLLKYCSINIRNLRQVIVDDSNKVNQEVRLLLFNDEFLNELKEVEKILSFASKISDKVGLEYTLADAVEFYFDLLKVVDLYKYKQLITNNFSDIITNVALASNYFHPVYKGAKFYHEELYANSIQEFLIDELSEEGMSDYFEYESKNETFLKLFERNIKSPKIFWLSAKRYYPSLAKFCLKLCAIPAFCPQNNFQYLTRVVDDDTQNKIRELYYLLKINELK